MIRNPFETIFKHFWVLMLVSVGIWGAGIATVIYVAGHFLRKVW